MQNYPLNKEPSLQLIKPDPDGKPLPGVTFRIARIEDGTHYLDRVTDQNGEIRVEGLEAGVYSIVETATVEGFILDSTEHHVELFPGRTSTIALSNNKKQPCHPQVRRRHRRTPGGGHLCSEAR